MYASEFPGRWPPFSQGKYGTADARHLPATRDKFREALDSYSANLTSSFGSQRGRSRSPTLPRMVKGLRFSEQAFEVVQ